MIISCLAKIETFIKETPISFEELQSAVTKMDWVEVYKIAHRMKPNFMMLGMKAQQDTAAQIEKLIKKEEYSKPVIQNLIQELALAAEQAYPILQQKLQEL